jgi:hypothetical protein
MSEVNTEAIRAFNESLERCTEEIDKSQIRVDLARVYQLVQDNKEAAYLSTEFKCILAQHQPNYLKVAAFVAWSYQFAFHDEALMSLVKNTVNTFMTPGVEGIRVRLAVNQILRELAEVSLHPDWLLINNGQGGRTFLVVDEYINWRAHHSRKPGGKRQIYYIILAVINVAKTRFLSN